jgi:hypothetical protein
MSTLKVNAVIDASGGNTATINSMTPTADSLQGFRNRIINGDMRIDQRNAGASVTIATSGTYTLDRWVGWASPTSKYSIEQTITGVAAPTGFTEYLGVTSLSAYSITSGDFFTVNQPIEGFNVADLAWGSASAKTVTLSFWVRSSLTGTFGGSVQNNAQNRSYPFTYTISAANTWEQKSVTIAGDTSGTWGTGNGVGIRLHIGLGVGSTYSGTAGSWAGTNYLSATGATSVVGTNGATFYITGVQLEVGSVATPFERRDYGRELIMCQRYLPAVSYAGSTYVGIGAGFTESTTQGRFVVQLPVSARTAPTGMTVSSAGHFSIFTTGASYTVSSFTFEGGSNNSAYFSANISAANLTVGRGLAVAITNASANMYFTGCEL